MSHVSKEADSMAENGKTASSTEAVVRAIRRQTRRKFSADEKIRIVLNGLRGESSIADLCQRFAPLTSCKMRTISVSLYRLPCSCLLI